MLLLLFILISPMLAIPAEYEYSPPRRFYFNNGELLVADELKNDPEYSEYYKNPPVRYWRFSYKNPEPEVQQPESRHERNWHHPVEEEFNEYYSQTHFQPKNEIDSMNSYIYTKNRKRGPPSGYYSNYMHAEDINVIPGHNHHKVTVIPSRHGGHRIRVYPEHSGHKIVVGNKHFVIHKPSNSELDMETTKFEMPNEIIPTVKPIKKPIKEVTKDKEKHDCFMNSCELEHDLDEVVVEKEKDPFDPVEGSADSFPLHESLLGNDQSLNDLDAPMLNDDGISDSQNPIEIPGKEPDSPARFFSLFSSFNNTEKPCKTPKDEPGHCRSFRDCSLGDVVGNLELYMQYTCLITSLRVGVCCPDNPVIEVTNPDFINENETDISQESIESCGTNPKTRIVGGIKSDPHEWTWMVALLRKGRFFCGGVLINNLYVLTAAHCVKNINRRDLTIRLGEYDFSEPGTQKVDIPIAEIKDHKKFSIKTFQHDIALLKLRHSVKLNRFVGTICLPEARNDFIGVNATVIGWGTTSFGGSTSEILRQVTIPVWDNKDCDKVYKSEKINDSFMCAGSPDKEFDACQGDSGGPLMSINERGRWQVIGLVSWGRGCGDPNFPGIYARVTTYIDWIDENMNEV